VNHVLVFQPSSTGVVHRSEPLSAEGNLQRDPEASSEEKNESTERSTIKTKTSRDEQNMFRSESRDSRAYSKMEIETKHENHIFAPYQLNKDYN
jgi:hypothetical protein